MVWVTFPDDGALGGLSVATAWCQAPSSTKLLVDPQPGSFATVNGASWSLACRQPLRTWITSGSPPTAPLAPVSSVSWPFVVVWNHTSADTGPGVLKSWLGTATWELAAVNPAAV